MPPISTTTAETTVPLCVDLDGTLIKTDMLWESFVRLLRQRPFAAMLAPFWWMKGRANLKAQIGKRVLLDPAALPYTEGMLDYLRAERATGRRILLVTASDRRVAEPVSAYTGVFDEVLASDGQTNLRGGNKARKLVELFGERGFDYAGNSTVDIPVWDHSRKSIVVSNSARLTARAANSAPVARTFSDSSSPLVALMHALRPHQWVKNLIIFVPLLTSHQLTHFPVAIKAVWALIAFCLCASGIYVMNDLLDLDADRHHPTKRMRPFASGEVALSTGLVLAPILLALGLLVSAFVSPTLLAVVGIYVVLASGYSWRWKQIALVDVFCLAGLYTIRLIAGHEATKIHYSVWLLGFSMFIFLSLALMKRYVEIDAARAQNLSDIKGRGYVAEDASIVATLGCGSGYLAALVMALYVSSQEVRILYRYPTWLLLICPLLLYWISRVWLLAHRGRMHEDPIVFALKDPVSYTVGVLALAVVWIATGL